MKLLLLHPSDDVSDVVSEAYSADDRRDSDYEWEDQIDDEEEEEAFQKRLQAFKSKAPPLSEEDNKRLDVKLDKTLQKVRDSNLTPLTLPSQPVSGAPVLEASSLAVGSTAPQFSDKWIKDIVTATVKKYGF